MDNIKIKLSADEGKALQQYIDKQVEEKLKKANKSSSSATEPADETAAAYLKQAQEDKDFPYLKYLRVQMKSWWDIMDLNMPTEKRKKWITVQRDSFITKAQEKELTSDQAMIGCYLFCVENPQLAVYSLLHLFMTVRNNDRVKAHNAHILSTYEEVEQQSIGEKVMACKFPLYPPIDPKLKQINNKILDKVDIVQGGGEAPLDEGEFFKVPEIIGGEYYEPILDSTGNQVYAIQMNETENRFNQIQNMFQQCMEEMRKERTPQSNRGRGRGVTPRGGYRGTRGGRGNYKAYGGTDYEAEQTASKNNQGL